MLSTGTKLGPYEIQSALGAGGMGAVYKARDTRLERTVAVKVLSGGPISTLELRQRFEREAKAISALQHPNICVLHDIGSQDGMDFLVMEYVEGETLAQRLRRGAMPIQQVLKMGMEISDALDKAHRAGLVHRDIKPANIMLTRGGAKLLDFGLAKPVSTQATSPVNTAINSALTAMTAMTAATQGQPLTQEGMIVGTYQYMAPEQIEAGSTDARSDLFAFGCVLYEAAVGRPAFSGKTQASVIASILASEPPAMSTVQPATPLLLERAIRACLAKDPEDRIHSAHDLKLQLGWALESDLDAQSLTAGKRRGVPWIALLVTAIVVAAAAIVGTRGYLHLHSQPQVIRTLVDLGENVSMPLVHSMALSPDGKMLAYVAQSGNEKPSLWIRPLSSMRAKRVDDTEGASYPFWSPDSRYMAFFVPGKLKKLDTAGWSVENLADADDGRGGTWNATGTIVFSPAALGGLMKVSASGGQVTALTETDVAGGTQPSAATRNTQALTHRWPQFLPDGETVLFISMKSSAVEGDLLKVRLSDRKITRLRTALTNIWYADSKLLSVTSGKLSAQPVKGDSLEPAGDPYTLAENVSVDNDRWAADFAVSNNGLLIYRASGSSDKIQLSWMDVLSGKIVGAIGEPGSFSAEQVSPDGTKIAMLARNPNSESGTLAIMDVARGLVSPLMPLDGRHRVNSYVWTPDSKSLIVGANLAEPNRNDLYLKPISGEPERLLLKMDNDVYPSLVTQDGRFVLLGKFGGKATRNDIWLLPLTGERKPMPLLVTAANESLIDVSSDGRWMLYSSDESGRTEMYITTFPVPHGRWQVSANGSAGGGFEQSLKRVAVVGADSKVSLLAFDGKGSEPKFGKPEPALGGDSLNKYSGGSITPDWKHFVIGVKVQTAEPKVTLITNWTEELKK